MKPDLRANGPRSYEVLMDGRVIGVVEKRLPTHRDGGAWQYRNDNGAYGQIGTRREAIDALMELDSRNNAR